MIETDIKIVAAGIAVAALGFFLLSRRGVAAATGSAIGGAAVGLADGAVTGVVKGIGGVVGVPDTNETECDRAIREGRTWDASFACPAKKFLGYVFGSTSDAPPPLDTPSLDGLGLGYYGAPL